MNVPIEAQRVAQAGGLAQEQEKQRGALAVQESKGGKIEELHNLLNQARLNGADPRIMNRISMNPNGGFSVGFDPQPPPVSPGLSNRLTKAEQDFANAQSRWFNVSGNPAETAALNTARGSVLDAHHASPGLKSLARQIISDPKLAKLPTSKLVQGFKQPDGSPMSPADQQALSELLRIHRGKEF